LNVSQPTSAACSAQLIRPVPPLPAPPPVLPTPEQIQYDIVRARIDAEILRMRQDLSKCTRSDLYLIESAIFQLCDDAYVTQSYTSLRERYRGIVGADAYKAYLEGQRPDPKAQPLPIAELRQDCLHLISEMRRLAIAIPRREEIRSWLLIDLLLMYGVIVFVLSCIVFFWRWNHFPFAWVVAIWSLTGGVISVLRRLQKLPDEELNLAHGVGFLSLLRRLPPSFLGSFS
jgi:hypothetical protein